MAVFVPQENMHGALRDARKHTQIIQDPGIPAPMVLNHDDVVKYVASREARCQEGELLTLTGITNEYIHDFWREIMFSKNGAEHRRLRQLIAQHYTVPAVKPDRPLLRARAEFLIDALPEEQPFDLVSAFVEPIVGFGICNRAGYEEKDHARVMSWGRIVTKIFVGLDAEDQGWVGDGFKAMFDHLDEVIAERQAAPRDEVLDRLIAAHNDGLMSYQELRAMLGNIVTGGYATTQYALIWLVWYLLNLPEAMAQVRGNPLLLEAARKELLRMEPPVEGTFRTAEQDIEAGGCPFHRGETFMISIMSSNRDPGLFADPDMFQLDRDNRRLMSFGAGPHRCLGAHLANAIIEEAASALLQKAPGLGLADQVENWTPADGYREVEKLMVTI
jgi:cytochrome P450